MEAQDQVMFLNNIFLKLNFLLEKYNNIYKKFTVYIKHTQYITKWNSYAYE